jgi:integrase
MSEKKWKTRTLKRGLIVKNDLLYIRIRHQGRQIMKSMGNVKKHPHSSMLIDTAERELNALRHKLRFGLDAGQVKQLRLPVEKAVDLFTQKYARFKASYPGHFKVPLTFFARYFAGRYLDSIKESDMRSFRADLISGRISGKPVRESTANRYQTPITTLFHCLRKWVRKGEVDSYKLPEENPSSAVKKAKEDKYVRKVILTPDEFRQLLTHAPDDLKRLIAGSFYSTIRLTDLRMLTWQNVSLEDNTVSFVQRKTGRPNTISMSAQFRALVESAPRTNDKLFAVQGYRYHLTKLRELTGLKRMIFSDLRKTAAVWIRRQGHRLEVVQELLGHSDIRTTMTYLPTSLSDGENAVKAIQDYATQADNCNQGGYQNGYIAEDTKHPEVNK